MGIGNVCGGGGVGIGFGRRGLAGRKNLPKVNRELRRALRLQNATQSSLLTAHAVRAGGPYPAT